MHPLAPDGLVTFWHSDEDDTFWAEPNSRGHFDRTLLLSPGVYTITLLSASVGPFTLLAQPTADADPAPDQTADASTDDANSSSDDFTDDSSYNKLAYYDDSYIFTDDSQSADSTSDPADQFLDDSTDPLDAPPDNLW
jgi:hypothetical protein